MMKRTTLQHVKDRVAHLQKCGYDIEWTANDCGVAITNIKGDTYLSDYGTAKEILSHFLKGLVSGAKLEEQRYGRDKIGVGYP